MSARYQPITNYDSCDYCDKCLSAFPVYKLKWKNKKVRCVLNDNRSVVLYSKNSQPVRYYYRNIKRIEKRPRMKLILLLGENEEVELRGWQRKSAFNALKNYFTQQILV